MDLKELKLKARCLKPMLRIGKAGLTESVINEVKSQLKKKKLVKIKLLRPALDKKTKEEIFSELAKAADAEVVSSVGFMITLFRN